MLLRIFDDLDTARQSILCRRPTAAASLPPEVRESLRRALGADLEPEEAVAAIIAAVRTEGDRALARFCAAFDGRVPESWEVPPAELDRALASLPASTRAALELAAHRIRRFHERALPRSWIEPDSGGTFGQLFRPIERVGVYAPGGRAAYPSTVLMTVIPARVAGVEQIVLCTPDGVRGSPEPTVLAAARVAGVDRVFRVGGAQAIAALAFGTDSIPRVDKIVGPGNLFVALAKKQVYGTVGIDQIAGPTETVIIADASASPTALAADLLAQAEHDPLATAILLTDARAVAEATACEVERQITTLPRREIIRRSLESTGGAVIVPTIESAIELANAFAPEHLCLAIRDPWAYVPQVKHAGGIFLGERSAEAIGDYTAGPSHVMPTGGTARFASPLGVHDFLKISSIFDISPTLFEQLGPPAALLARAEGLDAHAAAVHLRQDDPHRQGEIG